MKCYNIFLIFSFPDYHSLTWKQAPKPWLTLNRQIYVPLLWDNIMMVVGPSFVGYFELFTSLRGNWVVPGMFSLCFLSEVCCLVKLICISGKNEEGKATRLFFPWCAVCTLGIKLFRSSLCRAQKISSSAWLGLIVQNTKWTKLASPEFPTTLVFISGISIPLASVHTR